ncbi:TetR/AcrR family transcriptional regulator, partial [Pseudoflavonifractor phocaeensis]
ARESEYSKATLYVYFQSKEEIINAIFLSGLVLLQRKLQEAIDTAANWYEAYEGMCAAVVRYYGERPEACGVLVNGGAGLQEDAHLDQEVRDILRVRRSIGQLLADFLRQGAQEGLIRLDLRAEELVLLFWSALEGIVRMASQRDAYLGQTLEVDRDVFLRHGCQMLLHAITNPAPAEEAAQPE